MEYTAHNACAALTALHCRLARLAAGWCFMQAPPTADTLPADVHTPAQRAAVLLAAGEAGLRMHCKLDQLGQPAAIPRCTIGLLRLGCQLTAAALEHIGVVQATLLQQGSFAAAAAEHALCAAAGLQGTVLKVLLRGSAVEEGKAALQAVLEASLGWGPALAGLLLEGGSLRPDVPLCIAR